MNVTESTDLAAMDVAPTKRWRRFVPAWLRSLIWVDSAGSYDAFLSYSWTCDKEVAPVVQSVIHRFLCPWYKVRAKTAFRDLSCLPAGSSLNSELFSRLDRSTHLIVLASPEAPNSRGMEAEACHWLSRQRAGEVLILVTGVPPNKANGDGNPVDETKEISCGWNDIRDHLLPPALRTHFATSEPLWLPLAHRRHEILNDPGSASLRGAMIEDLKQLFLRLYPGTTWEELHGEERSQKRRAMSLLGGLAALFLLAALSLVWEWSNTIKARDEAASNYSVAIGVVNSTSEVVKEQLLPDGTLQPKSVLADNLLSGPLKAFEQVSAKYETPKGAYSRAQLFDLLWNNFYVLGKLTEASSAAEAGFEIAHRHEIARQQEKGDPSRADWLRLELRAQEHRGDNRRAIGDLTSAETHFKEALQLAQQLPSGAEGVAWKNELPLAYERLGDILRDEGKFSEALLNYKKFLEFPTAGEGPHEQRELAVAHGKIADMLVEQGDLGGAEQELQTDLAISQKLAAQFPSTGDWLRGVIVAHERLGFVYRKQGRLPDATREYRQDLEIADRLAKSDSANVLWRSDQALGNEGLGDVARDKHNWSAASEYYSEYLAAITRVQKESPTNAKWRRDVAVGYQRLGDALLGLGRKEEARNNFERCLSASDRLIAAFDPRNPDPRDVHEYCRARAAEIASSPKAAKPN